MGYADLTDDPQGTAAWLNLLAQAEAASVETRVRLAQPDLDEDEVRAEVARIREDRGTMVPDPLPGLEVS